MLGKFPSDLAPVVPQKQGETNNVYSVDETELLVPETAQHLATSVADVVHASMQVDKGHVLVLTGPQI